MLDRFQSNEIVILHEIFHACFSNDIAKYIIQREYSIYRWTPLVELSSSMYRELFEFLCGALT